MASRGLVLPCCLIPPMMGDTRPKFLSHFYFLCISQLPTISLFHIQYHLKKGCLYTQPIYLRLQMLLSLDHMSNPLFFHSLSKTPIPLAYFNI